MAKPPPWRGVPAPLEEYRARGHRRLAARTCSTRCQSCIWACTMPVELILDHWDQNRVRYRVETFCYGPVACRFYKPGPTRKVPGRKPAMVWEEEDWIDQESVAHRADWD